MWSPCWSILACKIPQFFDKNYRFRQLITLFQKVDTLRLLRIYIMFCTPARAKYPFFRVKIMDYTFYPQDQTFLMQCSFSDSDHHQQLRQNGKREQISFGAFKNSFFINIKSISIKEVKLSTKGHMQKNSFEIVLRYSFEIKFKTSTKYRA